MVDYTAVCTFGTHQHNFAGIAIQFFDCTVVYNRNNAAFSIGCFKLCNSYTFIDVHFAGIAYSDALIAVFAYFDSVSIFGIERGKGIGNVIVPFITILGQHLCSSLEAAYTANSVVIIAMRQQRSVSFDIGKLVFAFLIAEIQAAAFAVPVFHGALGNTGGVFLWDMLQIMSGRRKIHLIRCKFIAGHVRMQEEIPAAGAFPAAHTIIVLGTEINILLMKHRLINPLIRCQRKGDREILGAAGRKVCRNCRRKGFADFLVTELPICIREGMFSAVGKERIVAVV